jgi:hypothetical protein
VAWLATEGCTATGKTFYVQGGRVGVFKSWTIDRDRDIDKKDRWGVDELGQQLAPLLDKK